MYKKKQLHFYASLQCVDASICTQSLLLVQFNVWQTIATSRPLPKKFVPFSRLIDSEICLRAIFQIASRFGFQPDACNIQIDFRCPFRLSRVSGLLYLLLRPRPPPPVFFPPPPPPPRPPPPPCFFFCCCCCWFGAIVCWEVSTQREEVGIDKSLELIIHCIIQSASHKPHEHVKYQSQDAIIKDGTWA